MAMNPRLLRPLATGFNPKSLGTLALWLDGADRSRMFSDDAATTLSADDGQVAVYKEKANGYNLTQTEANNRPLVRSAFLNGKSVLDFDGSNDRLVSPALADDWLATTYFAVIQTTGASVNPHLFARAALVSFFPSGTSMTFFIAPNGTGLNTGASTLSLNAWARVSGRWDGGTSGATSVSARINAANVGTGVGISNRVSLATEPVNIGNRPAGDRPLDGYIAELLIYSQSLSDAAILKVEGYLAWKWGLQAQLPYDHPYAKSFPGFGAQTTPTDSDTLTYLAAVKAADGTGVEVSVANAVDDFVKGCKQDGIWDAIKASCILAGARTLAGALVPLRGVAPTNTNFVSGDYNRETGLKADGNKYLDANRNNNADPQNSSHHSVYVTEADSSGSASSYIDAGGTGTGANNIGRSSTVANLYLRNRTSSSGSVASGASTGLIGTNRSESTGYVVRASGSETTITQASQTPADSAVFVYGRPPGPTNTTNARLAFYSIGESLSLADLDTRVSALITAIGAAI